jgi:Flp pilus assembly protein TadD
MNHKYTDSDIFKHTECPSDALLLSYVKGKVNHEQKRSVELHLIDCEMCNDMVEGYQRMEPEQIDSQLKSLETKINETVAAHQSKGGGAAFKWYYAAAAVLLFGLTGILYQFYFKSIEETKVADLPQSHQLESPSHADTTTTAQTNLAPPSEDVDDSKSMPDESAKPIKSVTKTPAIPQDEAVAESDAVNEMPAPPVQQQQEKLASESVIIEAKKNTEESLTSGSSVVLNETSTAQSYKWKANPDDNAKATAPVVESVDLNRDEQATIAIESDKNIGANKKVKSATTNKSKAEAATPAAKKEAIYEQEESKSLKDVNTDDVKLLNEIKQQIDTKQYSEAIQKSNLYLKTYPKNCEVIACRAQAYESTNQSGKAIKDYTQVSKLNCGKQSDTANLKLAAIYLKNNQANEAKALLQKATKSQYLDIAEQAKKELDKLK